MGFTFAVEPKKKKGEDSKEVNLFPANKERNISYFKYW